MTQDFYTNLSVENDAPLGCPVTALGEAFNPFTDPYLSDPYSFLAHARENEPVFYSPENQPFCCDTL